MQNKSEEKQNVNNIVTEVQGLASISKKVKESVVNINRSELRFLVDSYYQRQKIRKSTENQIRSLKQGFDSSNEENDIPSALSWIALNQKNEETQIKKMLESYVLNDPVGRWAMSNMGVGPISTAAFLAYFDIDKATHYGQFWSYAGLNNNNNPWLGTNKATIFVNGWLKNHPDENPKDISDNIVVDACVTYNRTYASSINQSYDKNKLESGKKVITKNSVIAWLSKPPYNLKLKTVCWNLGESFLKVSNKEKSLYGRLIKERMVYEKSKNEKGEYAEEAKKKLESCNIQDKKTKEIYESGKLPDGHILERCKRYAVKIFISHLFEAMWYNKYHVQAPVPYPIEHMGHDDYIYPENDYREFI